MTDKRITPSSLAFSWRMLWRDWRSGELRIVSLALIIAVTSVTAVGFFIDRVDRGMQQQAGELIGADLVVTSSQPLTPLIVKQAQQQKLKTAHIIAFRSVALTQERPQLVEVKAVSAGYPFRGALRTSAKPFAKDVTANGIPPRTEVWVEPRLLQLLGIAVGDRLQLGASTFTISRVLTYEPDRGGDMFSVAPRVLMNHADVPTTQLIRTGALAKYRLLIAGQNTAIEKFRKQIEKQLQSSERILTIKEGRPELRSALDHAQRFLGLAALISVLLAGVAVATSARRFAQRHTDTSAILRCLGATQSMIIRIFSLEMLWLALVASSAGVILGLLTQAGISQILGRLLLTDLPAPSAQPLLLGYATGIVLLLGFAIPPMLALSHVPPLRVLRRDQHPKSVSNLLMYAAVIASMGILLYWQIGEARLVVYVLIGMIIALVLLAVAAYGLIRVLNTLRQQVGVSWRFGFANIARRPATSVIQIVAFGLGIMALLLLSTVRTDLLANWQASLPADAPNHFLINVQPDQVKPIQKFISQQGIDKPELYPMVRARLVRINQKKISMDNYQSERAKHLVSREFNLSWANKPQADNKIMAGRWWKKNEHKQTLISLEHKLAKTLGIALHDKIAFVINGRELEFKVTSLREVNWDSFNINFFTVVPPGVLETYPASWVTSLFLSNKHKLQLGKLVKQFPNITVVDVGAIMDRVRQIMDRVILAVEFIFMFTLLAGLAVLYAAIQANQDERKFENAVLKTLGAKQSVLWRGLIAEFLTLGAMSGLLAGITASGMAWLLATYVFNFAYSFNPMITLIGVATGMLVVGIAGILGTRSSVIHPPINTLRLGDA